MVVKRRAKPLLIALISIAVLIVVLLVSAIVTWNVMMSPVDKNNDEQIEEENEYIEKRSILD